MKILNIAGYKFIALEALPTLRSLWLEECLSRHLKGTILVSPEGVNITLAGLPEHIASFKQFLREDSRFADMTFRESYSAEQPFHHMRVKLKKEIITFRRPEVRADVERAPSISPRDFKKWLDEKRDITILDTRNEYEVRFGTFDHAEHFPINDFSEFPEAAKQLQQDKPVVMFCTGGVRCEKAALHLLNQGFPEVYQLDGGILNYFAEVGGTHYHGDCFVFDHRVAVGPDLTVSGVKQCQVCEGPKVIANDSCPTCVSLT